jgi:hypothetical protein
VKSKKIRSFHHKQHSSLRIDDKQKINVEATHNNDILCQKFDAALTRF